MIKRGREREGGRGGEREREREREGVILILYAHVCPSINTWKYTVTKRVQNLSLERVASVYRGKALGKPLQITMSSQIHGTHGQQAVINEKKKS